MKKLEMIGYYRHDIGKKYANKLRQEANVPCVLYGGEKTVHFYSPMILFRDLVYTPEVHVVDLNIEGDHYECILQDLQINPVSEVLNHADFLQLRADKEVKIDVPVKLVGTAPGVMKGGKLVTKLRKIKIKALPQHLPDYIEADISGLDLGQSIKIGKLKPENVTILNSPLVTLATVEIPRALKGAGKE